jgi:hypothetical protein
MAGIISYLNASKASKIVGYSTGTLRRGKQKSRYKGQSKCKLEHWKKIVESYSGDNPASFAHLI